MSRSEIRRVEPMSTEGNPCQIRGFMEQDMITMPMPTSMSMPMSMSMPRSRPPEGRNALPERGSKPMGDMPAEMKVMSSSGMPPDAQLPKVLLVDDDQELTIAIEKRLTEAGFEVKRASTCVDGYWTALKEQPDAIVADYVMPDSYGSYLVRRLREHPLTKNIPVIVLTGCDLAGRTTSRSDYSLERQFLNMGAETVLRKPIDHQSLVHEIRRHVHFPVQTHIERMRELEPCS